MNNFGKEKKMEFRLKLYSGLIYGRGGLLGVVTFSLAFRTY